MLKCHATSLTPDSLMMEAPAGTLLVWAQVVTAPAIGDCE